MTNPQKPPAAGPRHRIEISVSTLAELFNSMDPTPFLHRDLDPAAEEFIESWALDCPHASEFDIVVHLADSLTDDPTPLVSAAIHNYFQYKAEFAARHLRTLFAEGRVSLVIGFGFLAACLLSADLLARLADSTLLRLIQESLLIGGWVAMWRPLQIFLYEWWPIARRRRVYESLGRAEVEVLAAR